MCLCFLEKLIIDQVACSPSSGDSSESLPNSEVSEEEEYKVTPRRRKRQRLHLTSHSTLSRPGPKRRVAVVVRQVDDGQVNVDQEIDESIPPVNVQPPATVGDRNSNASTSHVVSGSTSMTTVAVAGDKQEGPSTSVKVEASSGSEEVESDFGGNVGTRGKSG